MILLSGLLACLVIRCLLYMLCNKILVLSTYFCIVCWDRWCRILRDWWHYSFLQLWSFMIICTFELIDMLTQVYLLWPIALYIGLIVYLSILILCTFRLISAIVATESKATVSSTSWYGKYKYYDNMYHQSYNLVITVYLTWCIVF